MDHGGIDEIIRSGHPPGKIGGKKGPGSCNWEKVFSRPDPVKDMTIDAKRLEESGQMTPETAKWAKAKIEAAKARPSDPVDYDKVGHPLDGVEPIEPLGDKDGGGLLIGE
jgi:hypothetical protein